ncbi:uncharacterized protein LOC129130685 isoform X1 [Agelaius phoeniceus]|uniref:uncharacterized protein LOC129130685 isoform X1 n=1 Tax=Agelaius phoeniceus TaxID=39638 RepID=UPI004054E96E
MAPLRRLCLCLLLALLPPPPAAPAPAPAPLRRPDWAACRVLSRELSRLLGAVREPYPVLVSTGGSENNGGTREAPGFSQSTGSSAGAPEGSAGESGSSAGDTGSSESAGRARPGRARIRPVHRGAREAPGASRRTEGLGKDRGAQPERRGAREASGDSTGGTGGLGKHRGLGRHRGPDRGVPGLGRCTGGLGKDRGARPGRAGGSESTGSSGSTGELGRGHREAREAPGGAGSSRRGGSVSRSYRRREHRPRSLLQEGLQLLEEEPQNWPPRIRCSDTCDPLSLESNHTLCLQRIRQALQHYRDLLGSDIFQELPQPQLESTMEQLLRLVQDGHGRPPRHLLAPTDLWEQPVKRHLALKRLRSFSALIGRVFNHGAR